MKTNSFLNISLILFSALALVSCSQSKYASPVIEDINDIYPNNNDVKVVSKSIIRAAQNKVDTLTDINWGEMVDKAYYFNIDTNQRRYNLLTPYRIDSIISFHQYEPVTEVSSKDGYYFVSFESEESVVKEILVYAKTDNEIYVIHIFGQIEMSLMGDILPLLTDQTNFSLPFL